MQKFITCLPAAEPASGQVWREFIGPIFVVNFYMLITNLVGDQAESEAFFPKTAKMHIWRADNRKIWLTPPFNRNTHFPRSVSYIIYLLVAELAKFQENQPKSAKMHYFDKSHRTKLADPPTI